MSKGQVAKRLSKVAREFNVGISTIVDFLGEKGVEVESNPNAKIDDSAYQVLLQEFQSEKDTKEESRMIGLNRVVRESISLDDSDGRQDKNKRENEEIIIKNLENTTPREETIIKPKIEEKKPNVVGKIDLDSMNMKTRPDTKAKEEPEAPKPEVKEPVAEPEAPKAEVEEAPQPVKEAEEAKETKEEKPVEPEAPAEKPAAAKSDVIKVDVGKLSGPTVVGKIELPKSDKRTPVASSSDSDLERPKKKRRKRILKGNERGGATPPADNKRRGGGRPAQKKGSKGEVNPEEIQNQIRETLARLSGGGKSKAAKYRRAKRDAVSQQMQEDLQQQEDEKSVLKVTEYVTVNELATMMDVAVSEIISACMSLGLFVSINQRLDAETLGIMAEEFGFRLEFVGQDLEEATQVVEDNPENLSERPPIVTVMGHVDHGKTSLLDHIRKANVIAGEAGGITQHIGAYNVQLDNGKTISFLDTPGHEAFTAMRARGAQITDVVIIVIAADDSVMPQTKEAINHAQAAGVPMIFAINKIDRPSANPDKIKEELSQMNILVEDWGGKYQCQEISARDGINIDELLEKVLLESELLELKADADRSAVGTVIESALDKGRGYVSTILVQSGTLRVGDFILAGSHFGKVKALHNERGQLVKEAGPSMPVSVLGLNGAPSAGDKFVVQEDEREAKAIATKRSQLQREQGVRTQKRKTLEDIGQQLQIEGFQEVNIIVKGDVDGSIEALADSLLKLTTESIQINVIHKSVGQITESDVLLATASNAIIVGFQVRPSGNARRLAEKEGIDIRLYSVIYNAIDEVKSAMEGMLAPKFEEKVVCNIEIREVFKISKVGTVAGCYVTEGTVTRNTKVRLIRDGVVVYTGDLGSLKRFKDDVKEVKHGYECGLNIANYNDIRVDDIIEGFEQVEVKVTL